MTNFRLATSVLRIKLTGPAKIQWVPRLLTAEDILPLVSSLPEEERLRLLRLIASPCAAGVSGYLKTPLTQDEFSSDDDLLAWEADGWDEFR